MTHMTLADLIVRGGLEPRETLVLRHTPGGRFRRSIPLIVEAAPDLLAYYEATQSNPRVIASFRACRHGLSFIGDENGRTIFAGAFAIGEEQSVTRLDYESDPRWARLHHDFGLDSDERRDPAEEFSIFGHNVLADWRHLSGRLCIGWSNPISWCRRAHSSAFPVDAILEESAFSGTVPSPDRMILRAPDLAILPPSWRARMAGWRGIYLITDEADGARYVGAAYGAENLLGRWRAHVAGETGVTKELSRRKTNGFRFSILELLAETAGMEEVVALERRWMDRLHTIEHGLNT